VKLSIDTAEIYIPDNVPVLEALSRTTHLCIAAHQDDVEIMAPHPILECFQRKDKWFTAVVMTDGRGSPRSGIYKNYSDEDMRRVRIAEQLKAAIVGEYSALIMLDYPSKFIKDGKNQTSILDLATILKYCQPQFVYTHNLADKHDTHVAVALKTISASRSLPVEARPQKLYGCEVWRGLDWLVDADKIVLNVSQQENLQAALLGIFDSQISGGKRYDLASLARLRANATFFESHEVDVASALSFTMDLSPLLKDEQIDPLEFVKGYIQRFSDDVAGRIKRLL
jgi:LmbE family N-acetylglucosaminyl deacetylase